MLTVFRDEIYFLANDETHGRELFAFDGATIRLVADINPGPAHGYPSEFFVHGDKLLFRADDGLHGKELFSYDGRQMNLVCDIWKGVGYDPFSKRVEPQNGNPSQLFAVNDVVYFNAKTRNDDRFGDVGLELFAYDGKSVRLAQDLFSGPNDSAPDGFMAL